MQINKIIEVGASDFAQCYSRKFIDSGAEIHLFEPNKIFYKSLVDRFWLKDNVKLYNQAIAPQSNGEKFYVYGYASYLKGQSCLANSHRDLDGNIADYDKLLEPLSIFVPTLAVSEFVKIVDENTYLSLNCNGAEDEILPKLIKLPLIIRICIYAHHADHWMKANRRLQILNNLGYTNATRKSNKLSTFFELEFARK